MHLRNVHPLAIKLVSLLYIVTAISSCRGVVLENRKECYADILLEGQGALPSDFNKDFDVVTFVDSRRYDHWNFSISDFYAGRAKINCIKLYSTGITILSGWPEDERHKTASLLSIPLGEQAPYAFGYSCRIDMSFYDESAVSVKFTSLSLPLTVKTLGRGSSSGVISFTSDCDGYGWPDLLPHEGPFSCSEQISEGMTVYVPRVNYVHPDLQVSILDESGFYTCDIGWSLRENGYDFQQYVLSPISMTVNYSGGYPYSVNLASERVAITLPLIKQP